MELVLPVESSAFLQDLPIMIAALDKSKHLIFWNKKCELITGYLQDEMSNEPKPFERMIPGLKSREAFFDKVKTQSPDNPIICRMKTKTGEFKTISWTVSPITISDYKDCNWICGKDITEQENNRQAIENRNNKFQRLLERHTDVFFRRIYPNLNFEYISPTSLEVFGFSPEDFYTSPNLISSLIHPDFQDLYSRSQEQLVSSPAFSELEYQICSVDGETKWIRQQNNIVRSIKGDPVAVESLVTDITEQKAAVLALKESEEFHQGTLNDMVTFVAILEPDGTTLFINNTPLKVGGLTLEEVRGKLFYELFWWQASEETKNLVKKDIEECAQGKALVHDIQIQTKEGPLMWIEYSMHPIFDDNNNVKYVVPEGRNINERKEMELRLIRMQNYLNSIFNSLPSVLVAVDERSDITHWNNRTEAFTGLSGDQIKGHPIETVLVDFENQLKSLRPALEEKQTQLVNRVPTKKDDKVMYADLMMVPLVTDVGEGAVIRLDDVTDRVLIEEELSLHRENLEERVKERTIDLQNVNAELKEAKELADAGSKAKSKFLANMSHEIRTPMNSIIGFTEIMISKVKDKQLLDYLRIISSSGKSLLNIINDILDLSKIEAGSFKIENTSVDLAELAQELINNFSPKANEKNLDLKLKIKEGLPKTLLLDETRLRQILFNLVGNAIKFTEAGYVDLKIHYSYPEDGQSKSVNLAISVEDSGIGIPENQQEAIFSSFIQSNQQNVAHPGGTGLGLTITKHLAELMNGEIQVESTMGNGSRFTVILNNIERVTSEPSLDLSQSLQIEELPKVRFNKAEILIVDDMEYNRELIKEYLDTYDDFLQEAENGIETMMGVNKPQSELTIREAENGLEAIESVKKHQPDLILLDMKMPKMDGYEAASILSKDPKMSQIPIIAVTASAMKEDVEVISRLCSGYLNKPLILLELITEIMKFLPHTMLDDKGPSSKSRQQKLSRSILSQYPKVYDYLKLQKSKIGRLSKQMIVDDIEEFSSEIILLGKEEQCRSLVSWGEGLAMAIQAFDYKAINESFTDLYESV